MTHVFLSFEWNHCEASKYIENVTTSREPIQLVYSGFPVRKDFPYRREMAALIRRIFETGWDARAADLASWNCSLSKKSLPPMTPLDLSRFLSLYVLCCGFTVIVLVFEIAVVRLQGCCVRRIAM